MESLRMNEKPLDVPSHEAGRARAERQREAAERKREKAEAARVIREEGRVASEAERSKFLEALRESVDSLAATSAQMKVVEDMRRAFYKIADDSKKGS